MNQREMAEHVLTTATAREGLPDRGGVLLSLCLLGWDVDSFLDVSNESMDQCESYDATDDVKARMSRLERMKRQRGMMM